MSNIGRVAGLVEEGKELRPCAIGNLNRSDGSDNTSSRVADEFAVRNLNEM